MYKNQASFGKDSRIVNFGDLVNERLAKNIFVSANGNLVGKKDAKIVTSDTSSIEVNW